MEDITIRDVTSHYSAEMLTADGLHASLGESKKCCSLAISKDGHHISMTLYKHDVEALAAILSAIAKNMEART